jgi:phage-related protein
MGLPEGQKAKAFAFINFLAEVGFNIRRPFGDYLGDQSGLYELRPKPSRVIYFFHHKNKIVLLHAFYKKTKAIPEKELRIAQDRKENCEVLLKFNRAEFED